MRRIDLTPEYFQGHVSLEEVADGILPWRLPHTERELFPPAELQETARMAAGVRLRFRTDTVRLRLLFTQADRAAAPPDFDLLLDGQRVSPVQEPNESESITWSGLASGFKELELFLPQGAVVYVRSLEIDADAEITPLPDTRPRWITYGSSITQCHASDGPSQTWPALVAQRHNLHLTCLGFSGNCHLEPMMARLIRDLPADLISLCLGINVYGRGSLGPRTFKAAVIGFIQIIREAHPNTPLAVISPIASPDREEKLNPVGYTLQDYRADVEEAVEVLKRHGDANLHYVSGLTLMDAADAAAHMPDGLHPDAEGYRVLAERISSRVMREVFGLAG